MLRIRSVLGNSQRLDGGAMFGNVPRALWSRWCPPDDAGRIALACRALLIEDGARRILLETGIGSFFEPKLRERFGVVEEEHVLCRHLSELGVPHDEIDVVVLSHLHFDHAGGLLAAYEADKPPSLLFPKARFVVGEEAFARAKQPHPRDRASFIPELVGLLEQSGRLELVGGEADADLKSEALGPRFSFVRSYGHTPGMLHTRARGDAGEVFFCADLVPGVPWVHLPITMGYDRFPERLIDEKSSLFPDLLRHSTWLCFTHDTRVAVAQLSEEKGRFGTRNEILDADLDLDLDAA
ncbi:MAG: MBL fold metallo-hydrolase [Polyangiaceae bacterium]